jgi:FKBP-type peptidyl-prolyl cis-trans isomerase
MKKGSRAVVTIPSNLAYGEEELVIEDNIKIPKNATLRFEIEVVDWVLDDLPDSML